MKEEAEEGLGESRGIWHAVCQLSHCVPVGKKVHEYYYTSNFILQYSSSSALLCTVNCTKKYIKKG